LPGEGASQQAGQKGGPKTEGRDARDPPRIAVREVQISALGDVTASFCAIKGTRISLYNCLQPRWLWNRDRIVCEGVGCFFFWGNTFGPVKRGTRKYEGYGVRACLGIPMLVCLGRGSKPMRTARFRQLLIAHATNCVTGRVEIRPTVISHNPLRLHWALWLAIVASFHCRCRWSRDRLSFPSEYRSSFHHFLQPEKDQFFVCFDGIHRESYRPPVLRTNIHSIGITPSLFCSQK